VAPDRGSACEAERLRFAALDHTKRFRELLDRANRANVSFYPVDPRGVVVFDDDIFPVAGVGQNPAIPGTEDLRRRNERGDSLRMMADATDGVAVLDTNNFAPALQRITNDLSSYYLLGYYSSGKLDGRFHAITVRVTRPGVQIRARRGYLAAPLLRRSAAPRATPRCFCRRPSDSRAGAPRLCGRSSKFRARRWPRSGRTEARSTHC
jgi:hypothetical protein